jgi:hypothetical protein
MVNHNKITSNRAVIAVIGMAPPEKSHQVVAQNTLMICIVKDHDQFIVAA